MTIQEATQHFQVSEKTIRRWIKRGKLSAELIDGRWHVQADGQNDQTPDKAALIGQLQAENAHLRDQLTEKDNQLIRRDEQTDHLQQLLAVSQKSIGQLTEQNQFLLEPLFRPNGTKSDPDKNSLNLHYYWASTIQKVPLLNKDLLSQNR